MTKPDPSTQLVSTGLGRGVVIGAADPVPAAWSNCPVIDVVQDDLDRPTDVLDALHEAWSQRRPSVIRLHVDNDVLRQPRTWSEPLWSLGARFEPWTDRLQFLVWNNNYDARGGREPRWIWSLLAARLGATPNSHGADVKLPDGQVAWIDGGPRGPIDSASVDGDLLVTYVSVRAGNLVPIPRHRPSHSVLAPDQSDAVGHGSGPARIIAPAGSGKTRVLTERLRHLICDRGYERDTTLAVTYNVRARDEMVARCTDFAPRIQTLNSLGWQILREAVPGITLIDHRQQRELLARQLPPLDFKANSDPLGPYLDALGLTRLGLADPAVVEQRADDIPGFAAAFLGYRTELQERDLADYDEQLYRACQLLLGDATLRARWQAKCRHLLVDEFQDVTPVHLLLLRTLASPALDVFAVGDDDQVIYGHVGADPTFLIGFRSLFPGGKELALEVNYRCHPEIVGGAANLLTHNRTRIDKHIRAAQAPPRPGGMRVTKHRLDDGPQALVATIKQWLSDGCKPAEIAVLARVNADLLAPQIALQEARIPTRTPVGLAILERTGVSAALAYMRMAQRPQRMSSADVMGTIMRPYRGIPRAVLDALRGQPAWSIADIRALAQSTTRIGGGKLYGFLDDLRTVQRVPQATGTAGVLASIRKIGLDSAMAGLDGRSITGVSHLDDLDALASLATLHRDPASFEDWLRVCLDRPADPGGVTLATVHSVKGQEWNRVVVWDARAGMMPHRLAESVEEERRIFHVAITRARDEVAVLCEGGRESPFVAQMRSARSAPSATAPTSKPEPGRSRRAPQNAVAAVGTVIEVAGGHAGAIARIQSDGAFIVLSGAAGAGQVFVRYGERITVDGQAQVLAAPPI